MLLRPSSHDWNLANIRDRTVNPLGITLYWEVSNTPLSFHSAKEALVQAQHFPRIPGTYKLLEVLEMDRTSSLAGSGINIFFPGRWDNI